MGVRSGAERRSALTLAIPSAKRAQPFPWAGNAGGRSPEGTEDGGCHGDGGEQGKDRPHEVVRIALNQSNDPRADPIATNGHQQADHKGNATPQHVGAGDKGTTGAKDAVTPIINGRRAKSPWIGRMSRMKRSRRSAGVIVVVVFISGLPSSSVGPTAMPATPTELWELSRLYVHAWAWPG